jgi:hypothetical protein
VVILQENHANETTSFSEEFQNQIQLSHKLDFQTNRSHIDPNYYLSLSTLARWPILDIKTVLFPNPHWKDQTKTGMELVSFDTGLTVCNINGINFINTQLLPELLFHKDYTTKEGAEYVRSFINSIPHLKGPVVLAGDFNSQKYMKWLQEFAASNGLTNALEHIPTRPTVHGDVFSEGIYFSNDLNLLETKVIKTKTDHYLCYVELSSK